MISGTITALVTPFLNNGVDIDEQSLRKHVDRQVDSGVDVVVVIVST